MAAIHPDSPLIPKVMIRINEYYYLKENYQVAARVSGKFTERFPEHELASRMAFRWGQCHYKQEAFDDAAARFEDFANRYPDDPLCAEALFWAGESYRMDKDVPMAFRYTVAAAGIIRNRRRPSMRRVTWPCRMLARLSVKPIWTSNSLR